MRVAVVVAVSAILLWLLLFHFFSFVFYCEAMVWTTVATLWNNLLVHNQVNPHGRPVQTKNAWLPKSGGAHTVRASHSLYADPWICIKSKVCFGHFMSLSYHLMALAKLGKAELLLIKTIFLFLN